MDLMTLLPDYYDKNETMQRLQEILSAETETLDTKQDTAMTEFFISTASTLLSRYEKIYGISVDTSKTANVRRDKIKAKLIGAGTTTKQVVQEIAENYTGGSVEIIEDNANSKFTIKFTGTLGVPDNLYDINVTVEEVKPAHLEVSYEYTYNTWSNLNKLTWGQAAAHTWEGIRTVTI